MESLLINPTNAVLAALIISVFISWFAIPIVVKVTSIRRLTDKPGKRKIHSREIPTLGGVGLYAGFTFGFLISVDGYMTGVNYFFLATLLLFMAGMKDDLITLDPKKKLLAEILAALLLLYFTDVRITNFHGFLGIQQIPAWLTYCTTIFIVIVIVNALNLIDGIDGLAATTGIISSAAFGAWFWLAGMTGYAVMAAAIAGSLIGFMRFNMSNGKFKIFMGDTGSLLLGFILAAMTIAFNEGNADPAAANRLYSAPAISIAILIVPLFDTLRVFTIRIIQGVSPFSADNRHIHHMMLRAGFSHRRTDFCIAITQVAIIALAFMLDSIGILWLSMFLLAVCLVMTFLVFVLIYARHLRENTPIRKEDYTVIRIIATFHGWLTRKEIRLPYPVEATHAPEPPVRIIYPEGIPVGPKSELKREGAASEV